MSDDLFRYNEHSVNLHASNIVVYLNRHGAVTDFTGSLWKITHEANRVFVVKQFATGKAVWEAMAVLPSSDAAIMWVRLQ